MDEEVLRKLSYHQLKKEAKKIGLKGNLKANTIISALLSHSNSNEDSFVLLEKQIMESSSKNEIHSKNESIIEPVTSSINDMNESMIKCKLEEKENNEMLQEAPLSDDGNDDTFKNASFGDSSIFQKSRRETYSVEAANQTLNGNKSENVSIAEKSRRETYSIEESNAVSNSKYVTPKKKRTSDKIVGVNSASLIKVSKKHNKEKGVKFITPRRSPRLSLKTSSVNLKIRPKTPIPSKKMHMKNKNLANELNETKASFLPELHKTSTPHINKEKKLNFTASVQTVHVATPRPTRRMATYQTEKQSATPKHAKQAKTPQKELAASGKKSSSSKCAPNFKKIHNRVFAKMESIDDYQKRKMNSAKKINKKLPLKKEVNSKIPIFSGIPFIPTITSVKNINLNFNMYQNKIVPKFRGARVCTKKENKPNPVAVNAVNLKTVQNKKNTFDLKASLAKKLPYKPYRGALKPLSESVANTSKKTSQSFQNKNEVIKKSKEMNREVLRGVRKNKRFELQMSKRLLT